MSSLGNDNPDITGYLEYSNIHLYYTLPVRVYLIRSESDSEAQPQKVLLLR